MSLTDIELISAREHSAARRNKCHFGYKIRNANGSCKVVELGIWSANIPFAKNSEVRTVTAIS
jgi:hypothetical protein